MLPLLIRSASSLRSRCTPLFQVESPMFSNMPLQSRFSTHTFSSMPVSSFSSIMSRTAFPSTIRSQLSTSSFTRIEIPEFNPPNPDGSPELSPKALKLVEEILKLDMLECAQLAMVLQERLGISDAALYGTVSSAPAAAAAAEDEPAAAPEQAAEPVQSTFTIKLSSFEDGAKFKVLKEIRTLKPGLSLTECKNLIDNLPSVLLENADKDTVQKWTDALQAVGASVLTE